MSTRPRTFSGLTFFLLLLGLSLSRGASRAAEDESETLRFLLLGEPVKSEKIRSGITLPRKLELEWQGEVREAAFKSVHLRREDAEHLVPEDEESIPLDSYRHEVAAYRLDRLLGIGMVPAAVIREIEGQEGAVIEWIGDAIDERTLQAAGVAPRDEGPLDRQREVMILFDALILNLDRTATSQLVTTADWKLHLIDHSRGFREWRKLPPAYLRHPSCLPRPLMDRLEELDREGLEAALEGLVSGAQIEALLARRDLILEKIAADRLTYGDEAVFLP